jgi:hypothetical protein
VFGKPINSITAADIGRLVGDAVRESDIVEFKEALSGKGGPDAWHQGAPSFAPAARDKIINEVIAFANAHGGTLVLGIAETDDKPARADNVVPIQRCADLADRLSRALADTVEPPLAPFPTVVPVLIEGDAGVVVFQVTASRNTPHRHRGTLESYVRRGEQAVQMTMREIQDLTLQVDRGLARIERSFEHRATICGEWIPAKAALTLRATAIPLSTIEMPGVPGNVSIYPRMYDVAGIFVRGGRAVAHFPVHLSVWRPILRGVRTEERRDADGYRVELRRDGLVEFVFAVEDDQRLKVFPDWVMGLACNALIAVEKARHAAGAPTVEYGLELAIHSHLRPLHVSGYGDHSMEKWGPIDPPGFILPRYSVGDRGTFEELLDLIQRDFWNAAGRNLPDGELLKVNFEPYLRG